ncbi:alpha/beta hydrolase family protein [Streptomyces sp. NRRL B-1347]|uniref:alpha/beta hydrolase family protein n=1 Tax=Streptomyces sp. NRRL B-1347 TaxID=1476877 RepID=UPI00068C7629|nr:alpha/beta fold hydrolase [Streptomyces sp. NRRL B-1347]
MTGSSTHLTFPGSQGTPLAAILDLPARTPAAYAVFAHCFTCSKDSHAAARIARALTAHRIAVLRFDFTGLGQSGGDFASSTFSSNVSDLVRAADHLRDHYTAPSLLIGHSLGGAAVLAATHCIPEVRAVATIAAPAAPDHVVHQFAHHRQEIAQRGQADVTLAGRSFNIRQRFIDDLLAQPQAMRIRTLDAALLVLHAPTDQVVDVDNARQIFDTARHPKSYVSLPGADHLLSNHADAQYAAAVLAAWAGRYTPAPADTPRSQPGP